MRTQSVLLAVLAAILASPAQVHAQLAMPSWLPAIADVSGSYSRISNFIDGDILNQPRSVLRHAQGEPLGIGRTRWTMGIIASQAPSWLEAELFVDDQRRIWGEDGSLAALAAAGARARGESIAPGEYPFVAHSHAMRRWGLALKGSEPRLQLAGARITWSAQLFIVDQFRHVDLHGLITSNPAGDIGVMAAAQDSKLGNSDYVRPGHVLGFGVSGGVAATWGEESTTHLRVQVDDIGPRVHLSHVLRTDVTANTDRASFDDRGYIHFAPLISGRYTSVPYSARQYARLRADGAWMLDGSVQLLARVDATFPVTDLAGGAQWSWSGHRFIGLVHGGAHMPLSLELGWRWRAVDIGWRGDKLTPGRARVWGLFGRYGF